MPGLALITGLIVVVAVTKAVCVNEAEVEVMTDAISSDARALGDAVSVLGIGHAPLIKTSGTRHTAHSRMTEPFPPLPPPMVPPSAPSIYDSDKIASKSYNDRK